MRRSKRERAAYRKGWESDREATWLHNPYLDRYRYTSPSKRGQEREFDAWERGRIARIKWRERERQRLRDRFTSLGLPMSAAIVGAGAR